MCWEVPVSVAVEEGEIMMMSCWRAYPQRNKQYTRRRHSQMLAHRVQMQLRRARHDEGAEYARHNRYNRCFEETFSGVVVTFPANNHYACK